MSNFYSQQFAHKQLSEFHDWKGGDGFEQVVRKRNKDENFQMET